jgi:DNA modification methylase
MSPREEILADGVRLICGDCMEALTTLGAFDAVVTDPPYGVGFAEWDGSAPMEWLPICRNLATSVYVTTGIKNAFEWERPVWIASYSFPKGHKRAAGGGINAWEPVLIYGKNTLPLDHKQFAPRPSDIVDGHPCPKPLEPFKWIIRTATSSGASILDPFMGSGTTGVAAVKLGRRFTGIEIEPSYFDIACRRISEALKQPDLFIEPAKPATQERFEI